MTGVDKVLAQNSHDLDGKKVGNLSASVKIVWPANKNIGYSPVSSEVDLKLNYWFNIQPHKYVERE